MPVLTDKQRRDRDIYVYVMARIEEKVNGVQKYRYSAVMEMASKKFYLSSTRIAEIVREYVPEPDDPQQLTMELD